MDKDGFLSREISWRRIWFASFVTALVFFLYVSVVRQLEESRKINDEVRRIYELKRLSPNISPAQK